MFPQPTTSVCIRRPMIDNSFRLCVGFAASHYRAQNIRWNPSLLEWILTIIFKFKLGHPMLFANFLEYIINTVATNRLSSTWNPVLLVYFTVMRSRLSFNLNFSWHLRFGIAGRCTETMNTYSSPIQSMIRQLCWDDPVRSSATFCPK